VLCDFCGISATFAVKIFGHRARRETVEKIGTVYWS
jgi:hypothetical protein